MKSAFDRRIDRARELAKPDSAARELLQFYGEILQLQKRIFEEVRARSLTDARLLEPYFPELVKLARRMCPPPLAEFGRDLAGEPARTGLLLDHWEGSAEAGGDEGRFYARSLLQPFAEYLASRGSLDAQSAQPVCPFCQARPVAAVLRGEGDGARRDLLCSMCSTEWTFRRILCPNCGEEDKDRLPVFVALEFDAVRVEACDTCKTYIKAIDLTKNGLAVPVVDEVASVALSLWAEQHGYAKLEANLLGM
jgi:FdhE protein